MESKYNESSSLQNRNPARYMELRNSGIANPDFYLYWLETPDGVAAYEQAEKFMLDVYNEYVGQTSNVDDDKINQLIRQNEILIAKLESLAGGK